ncbi:MAG: endonuclease/exonuclease/phosphatase family protein [Polyangiaceae bacterium]|nr:endonuclease/exonuclease/phosphatase family protein [Polyangiaceae bacterium]
MKTLSLATLNVWNKSGPYAERLPLIRRELARLSPDIFAAQEVLRFDSAPGLPKAGDQAAEIAHGLQYYVSYSGGSDLGGGLRVGNALFSRHPIEETEALVLPGEETGEKRTLLYSLIRTPVGLLPTFVTHLNWKHHEGSVRLRQVLAIVDAVQARTRSAEDWLPPVLLGDFNAEPAADEIRYLSGLHVVEGKSVFFNDVWRCRGEGPGFTFDRQNPFAALAREPPRRIDYIFVGAPDRWWRGEPQRAELAFNQAEAGIFPSDHFGLSCEISVEKRGHG